MPSKPITVRQAISALQMSPDYDLPLLTEDGRAIYTIQLAKQGMSNNQAVFMMADLSKD